MPDAVQTSRKPSAIVGARQDFSKAGEPLVVEAHRVPHGDGALILPSVTPSARQIPSRVVTLVFSRPFFELTIPPYRYLGLFRHLGLTFAGQVPKFFHPVADNSCFHLAHCFYLAHC